MNDTTKTTSSAPLQARVAAAKTVETAEAIAPLKPFAERSRELNQWTAFDVTPGE